MARMLRTHSEDLLGREICGMIGQHVPRDSIRLELTLARKAG